jgi:hypothetical protein
MEYTPAEKEALSLFSRTDFKNITKNELVSYASKLNELRPEVAKEVLAQFPELAKMITTVASDYRGELEKIVESDDKSIEQVYGIYSKEIDSAADSRKEYNEFASKVLADLSKGLDAPDLSAEERAKIREQELDVLRMVDKKDTEIRKQEQEIASAASAKDTEKREFNWKLIGAASVFAAALVGIGTAALGGTFDLKLPKK